jgi:GNAT superfamily N-acetyltransferase
MPIPRPTFRPFHPGDGEALANLHRAAILATPGDVYARAELESWAAGLRPGGYAGAVQDGEIIDVMIDDTGSPIAFCGRREDSIASLYVHPDWQRHGLGGLLLGRAEAAIAGSGYGRVLVNASITAAPFYERHGYRLLQRFGHRTRGGLVLKAAELEKSIAI